MLVVQRRSYLGGRRSVGESKILFYLVRRKVFIVLYPSYYAFRVIREERNLGKSQVFRFANRLTTFKALFLWKLYTPRCLSTLLFPFDNLCTSIHGIWRGSRRDDDDNRYRILYSRQYSFQKIRIITERYNNNFNLASTSWRGKIAFLPFPSLSQNY